MQTNDQQSAELITKSEIRSAIQRELHRSGIVGSITAQLRRQVVDTLSNAASDSLTCRVKKQKYENLEQAALRSLVMEFFEINGLKHTMSVFASETRLDSYILSQEDALKTFGIRKGSSMYHCLTGNGSSGIEGRRSSKNVNKMSTLHLLLAAGIALGDGAVKITASTQTLPTAESLRARQDLDSQLTQIEEKYHEGIGDEEAHINVTRKLEEKMLVFQKQCEEKATKELEEKIEQFKSKTLESMRVEEDEHHQKEITALRSGLLVEFKLKFQKVKDDEERAKSLLIFELKEQELSYSHSRQTLLHEIDQLKDREVEGKHMIEKEHRKLRLEEQRVNYVLITANEKIQHCDEREKKMRGDLAVEFERVRCEAKQSYNEGSEAVKKQYDFYVEQVKEINRKSEK